MNFFQKILSMSWKKWLLIFVVLLVLIVGGRYGYKKFFSNTSMYEEYLSNDMMVVKWDIVNSLIMNGRAKFSSMQKLTFPQSGRITGVYKKVWDIVKEWDIIARMDTYEIDNELEQAKIDLENEERALERAMDTSKTELDILQAEKKYQALLYEQKNADTSLKLAVQAIENEYVNKKNDYAKLLNDYEKKQKEYSTKIQTYEEIMVLDKSNQILYADEVLKTRVEDLKFIADGVRKELDSLDKMMLYTTKYGNSKPDYYIYIGAKDRSTKNTVERFFREISTLATEIYDWANSKEILTFSEVSLKSQLIQQYEKLRELADKKTDFSIAVSKMIEASIESEGVGVPSISITDGRSLKTTANTAIDEILGLSTPETIGEKRKKELDDLKLELDRMKQEVDKAYIEYGQLEAEKMKKMSDAMMDYEMKGLEMKIAKADLDELKKGDNEHLRQIRNNIKQKQKYIETIMKKYDLYVLKANFDGVITKINLQVGDTVGSSSNATAEEKYVYIENPDNLEIQLDVDQTDVVKIHIGMPVQIFLDALPESPYVGTLLEIDTTAGDDMYGGGYYGGYGWGASYKAKVVFTKKSEDTILWAMTARVTIMLDEAYDVLMVPNIAISFWPNGPMVMKVENGKYKKVPVELWISDQANTEILWGLEEGDVIMGVFIDKEWMDAAGLNDEPVNPWEKGMMVG